MARWLLASGNRHKLEEIGAILADFGVDLVTPRDLGLELDVEEWGSTFAENAAIKAIAYAKAADMVALADDSGLEVDALDGAPGVYSARFAGADGDDEANNRLLLEKLADTPDAARTARYRCVIAVAFPATSAGALGQVRRAEDERGTGAADEVVIGGTHLVVTRAGALEGSIGRDRRGTGGFGYDPYFALPDGRHVAEIPAGEKNAISHRGEALTHLRAALSRWPSLTA